MNILLNNAQVKTKNSIYAGNISSTKAGKLKSTQDKAKRQQQMSDKIDFWEQQKSNLKNLTSNNIEDIKRKLEMLHTYEDQIIAVKSEYNNEQRAHMMDEANELGEMIAEEAKKLEPKTEEEKKEEEEEKIKEALSIGEGEGALGGLNGEIMETIDEILRENEEQKEVLEKLDAIESGTLSNDQELKELLEFLNLPKDYRPLDFKA